MNPKNSIWALLVMILMGTGCSTVHYSYQGNQKLTTGAGLDRPTRIIKHIEIHERQVGLIHGGIPVGEPADVLARAAEASEGHAGVVNIRIRDGQNFPDLIYSHVFCLGTTICTTWSSWLEGDVVDYVDPPALTPVSSIDSEEMEGRK